MVYLSVHPQVYNSLCSIFLHLSQNVLHDDILIEFDGDWAASGLLFILYRMISSLFQVTKGPTRMSDSEGEDFPIEEVKTLIHGCENFVRTRLTSLQEQHKSETDAIKQRLNVLEEQEEDIQGLRKRIKILEEDNDSLHKENKALSDRLEATPNCKCRELFQCYKSVGEKVFAEGKESSPTLAGPTAQQIDTEIFTASHLTTSTISSDMADDNVSQQIDTSYPDNSDTVTVEKFQALKDRVLPSKSANEPVITICSTPKSTPIVYTSLDEVPEDFRADLQRFYKRRSSCATKERLNDLQRAFIAYTIDNNSSLTPTRIADKCIGNGVYRRMWNKNFCPPDVKGDFRKYLVNKIKNMMTRKAFQDDVLSQASRLDTSDDI